MNYIEFKIFSNPPRRHQANIRWRRSLPELEQGDFLASNLARARFEDGTIAIGAELQTGLPHLWLPEQARLFLKIVILLPIGSTIQVSS